MFDEDNTGYVTIKNLRRVAKELGENISEEELQELIERADSNSDQQVTADDFYNIMTKKTFPYLNLSPSLDYSQRIMIKVKFLLCVICFRADSEEGRTR